MRNRVILEFKFRLFLINFLFFSGKITKINSEVEILLGYQRVGFEATALRAKGTSTYEGGKGSNNEEKSNDA